MLDRVAKYDQIAERFAERSYANLHFYMHRRLLIAASWGMPLRYKDSILELGCGDGYLAQLLVQEGFRYTGADMSPRMVAKAQERLEAAGLKANFMVADANEMVLSEPFDAVVGYMRAFFDYITQPFAVLKRFRPFVRKKIILDLDPRRNIPLRSASEILRDAGFQNVAWRPFFVPLRKKLPLVTLKMLVSCEDIPILRGLPLGWKFHVLLKGEVDGV